MSTDANIAEIARLVVWGGFAVALAFGYIAAKTNFCTMGAVSDIVNMGDWTRMRMWLLAIAVAMIGANALELAGLVKFADTIYTGPRFIWLANLLGGALFGFGMVLGSGCGSKMLIRVGAGNLKSIVVLLFLAVSAYMTLRGFFAPLRVGILDPVAHNFATTQDLPALVAAVTGIGRTAAIVATLLAVAGGLLAFVFARPEGRSGDVLLGGVGVGSVIVLGWYVTGVLGFVEEHPQTLERAFVATNTGRMESLSFVAPQAYLLELLMFWSDKSRVITFGIASALGVLGGAFLYALVTRSFRLEGFREPEDMLNHMVAGVLMGFGGVTALGCTIGQGLTGLSTLALGSFVAFAGLIAGARAGLKYQEWRTERTALGARDAEEPARVLH